MAFALAVAAGALIAPHAAASPLDAMKALPSGVYLLDEPADAWLHERCSYRGLGQYSSTLVGTDGVIATVLSTGGSVGDGIVLKIFRCAETPSFATAGYRPGPATVLTCADERPAGQICVPPVVRPGPASASASPLGGPTAPLMRSAHEPPPLPPPSAGSAFALRANAVDGERPSTSASASASASASPRSTTPRRSLEESAAIVTSWSPPKPRVRGDGVATTAATAPARAPKRSSLPEPRTKIVAVGRPPPAPPVRR